MLGNLSSISAAHRKHALGLEPVVEGPESADEDWPDDSWLKSDIASWLDMQGVEYSSSATKAELLELVE